jgi:hypothetical protein
VLWIKEILTVRTRMRALTPVPPRPGRLKPAQKQLADLSWLTNANNDATVETNGVE